MLSSCLVLAGKVEDLGSGEYKAFFTATAAGSYAVSASLNGTAIAGSPFTANVTAVDVEAACSYAAGDGLLCARSGHLVSILLCMSSALRQWLSSHLYNRHAPVSC